MGCHFHEIATRFISNKLQSSVYFKESTKTINDVIAHAIKHAVCFDVGKIDDVMGIKGIPGLFKQPYSNCYYEITTGEGLTYAIISQNDEQGVFLIWFAKPTKSENWILYGFSNVEETTEQGVFNCYHECDEKTISVAEGLISILWRFLSAINCVNVKTIENKPDTKLQKARTKRGKLPLYSFHTLYVDMGQKTTSTGGNGTHSSPRVHLRRGHPRQFSPGKWTWVQPCVVGNKEFGIVHKDYAAKYPSQED